MDKQKKSILWLKWKDINHPQAGGAEFIGHKLQEILISEGYSLTVISASNTRENTQHISDEIKHINIGNRYTVYPLVALYYLRKLSNTHDFIIDECNVIPFFSVLYKRDEKLIFLIHQLTRNVWFYQINFLVGLLGYIIEPFIIKLYRDQYTLTFAMSTKRELIKLGFKPNKVRLLTEHIDLEAVPKLHILNKKQNEIILFFSSLRNMKRPDHVIKAFCLATECLPNLKLHIVGKGPQKIIQKLKKLAISLGAYDKIIWTFDCNSNADKCRIMREAQLICVPSVKEGWGLIVSEAGSQGTPAIVYNTTGLVDAVQGGKSGYITDENTPRGMANKIIEAYSNQIAYQETRVNAWNFAKKQQIKKNIPLLNEVLDLRSET